VRLLPDLPGGPREPASQQSRPKEGRKAMRFLSHRFRCLAALTILSLLTATSPLHAQPLHDRIDQLIAAGLPDFDQQAAPPADDAEFLRRAYLDLTGTLPTA